MKRTLRRYRVCVFSPDEQAARSAGSVLLYGGAKKSELAHALASVGVYAPRGLDRVVWQRGAAIITAPGAEGEWRIVATLEPSDEGKAVRHGH